MAERTAYLFSKEYKIMSSEVKLRTLRKQKKLTQVECAKYLGIPVRTYQNYETDEKKQDTPKYVYMIQKLDQYGFIDESHGILSILLFFIRFIVLVCTNRDAQVLRTLDLGQFLLLP